jgi:hypothetical protein
MTIRTTKEDRGAAIDYFNKAEDNHTAMLSAYAAKHINAAGTLALQCAISSADALCVYFKGVRSVSGDDFDICEIIASISLPEAKDYAAVLRKIIGRKNLIQYERRTVSPKEAEEIVKASSRFFQWACSLARPIVTKA